LFQTDLLASGLLYVSVLHALGSEWPRPKKDVVAHIASIVDANADQYGITWFVREGRGGKALSPAELQNYSNIGSATQLIEISVAPTPEEEEIGSPS
jgi:hypothetical protein